MNVDVNIIEYISSLNFLNVYQIWKFIQWNVDYYDWFYFIKHWWSMFLFDYNLHRSLLYAHSSIRYKEQSEKSYCCEENKITKFQFLCFLRYKQLFKNYSIARKKINTFKPHCTYLFLFSRQIVVNPWIVYSRSSVTYAISSN